MTTNEKFEYLVEDPFFSKYFKVWVRVDDYSNMYTGMTRNSQETLHFEGLTSGMIDFLYEDWKYYQDAKNWMLS